MTSLNDRMEFDHVIEVHADGTITDRPDLYAPELYDDQPVAAPWKLMQGYTGQYGYNGPIMHPSEFIGGWMERDILNTPGIYVALVATNLDDPDGEPSGWAVAWQETDNG